MTTERIPAELLDLIGAVTIDCDHPHRVPRRLYVLTIEPLVPDVRYAFYVGSTSKNTETRLMEHRRGARDSALIFQRGRARPVGIRADLTVLIPTRCCKPCAENAEGLFAWWVNGNLGLTKCNRLRRPASTDPRPIIRPYGLGPGNRSVGSRRPPTAQEAPSLRPAGSHATVDHAPDSGAER